MKGKAIVEFFFEILIKLVVMLQIGLGIRKVPFKRNGIIGCLGTIIISFFTLVMLINCSAIWGGFEYFLFSTQKWLAIMWASDGDWSHWMTGGRYKLFSKLKTELIASNSFASFLNGLAGHGILLKCIQVTILISCAIAIFIAIYVLLSGIAYLMYYLIIPEEKLQHPKVVKYRKRHRWNRSRRRPRPRQ